MAVILKSDIPMTNPGDAPYITLPDDDAVAIIDAFTVTPSSVRKRLIDSTVKSLKDVDLWTPSDRLYFEAAHHEQASRINWRRPGQYTAQVVNSPVFTVDAGWRSEDATGYLDTGAPPGQDGEALTRDDLIMGVWVATNFNSNTTTPDIGATGTLSINSRYNSNLYTNINSSTVSQNAVSTAVGMSIARRTSSTDVQLVKNGAVVFTGTANSNALPTGNLMLLARQSTARSSRGQAFGFIGKGTPFIGKEAAFHAIIAEYLDAVGVAV